MPIVETRKLESVNGFVLVDLPDASNSVGPARLGAKLLASNATNYAREVTYGFALLEQQRGGMTIGLKVDVAERSAAVESASEELSSDLQSGRLVVDEGLRMPIDQLGAFADHDPRGPLLFDDGNGPARRQELVALGAAVVAERTAGLEGATVAIEGLSAQGIAIAREVELRGGRIGRVSTVKGSVSGSFTADDLEAAFAEHGAELPSSFGESDKPWAVWRGADVDVIFCGSSVGALSAAGAPAVGTTAVVATGVAPIATKALAILNAAGAPVSPAFLAGVGAQLVAFDPDISSMEEARRATEAAVTSVLDAVGAHTDGVYVGACLLAESFMRSWAEELPFGRPMA